MSMPGIRVSTHFKNGAKDMVNSPNGEAQGVMQKRARFAKNQRTAYHKGVLGFGQVQHMESLPGWAWSERQSWSARREELEQWSRS